MEHEKRKRFPENQENHSPLEWMKCRGILWGLQMFIWREVSQDEDNRTTRVDSHRWTIETPSYFLALHNNFLSKIIVVYALIENSFVQDFFLVSCILCNRNNKQTNNRVQAIVTFFGNS